MKHPPSLSGFSIPVRIYYEDTDAGGVVYYANYLKFFERCRTEWLHAIGYRQADLLRDPGIAFVVRGVNINYLRPARLDDELVVDLAVDKVSRAQLFFRQHVRRANPAVDGGWEVLVDATVHLVCVNVAQMKAIPIPAFLRVKLEALQ
ncbi:MAG TPA: tol-pal system-associated acyl-CoA thioesterase [Accumulibacter sp.]|jgi:acyl-CoA thioester hydrolase|nr:tol-pal system-associated acyl-CoA thioesterase [Accumulibacter sp.]